jgi:hypothetical protein
VKLGKAVSGIFVAIFLVYVTAGVYARWGGIEGSLQSLSHFGHKLLIPWALLACVCLIRLLWRDSVATTGSFELVELRKRNRLRSAVGKLTSLADTRPRIRALRRLGRGQQCRPCEEYG